MQSNRVWKFTAIVLFFSTIAFAWLAVKNSSPVSCDRVEFNQVNQVEECVLELGNPVPHGNSSLDVQQACFSGLDCSGITYNGLTY